MTTMALKPKTTTITESVPDSKEDPKYEISPVDETRNRGRKIKEIKKALKSMKKVSRGTAEDKERIARLEVILEHYVKEHKQQLSERYSDEFLKSKATIPSIITKFPKAMALSARKVATCIDQIKLSKTHKERAYNFLEMVKAMGQTALTPVVYAGKFVVDNWYLALLLPVLKPELFENFIDKIKNLINGNGAAEALDTPSIEQAITETTVPTETMGHHELSSQVITQIPSTGPQPVAFGMSEGDLATSVASGTQEIEFPEQIDIDALIAEGNVIEVEAQVAAPATGTQEIEFPEQIDIDALIAEGNVIEAETIVDPNLNTEVSPEIVDSTELQYETFENGQEVEDQVPIIALNPIDMDPTQETVVDETLSNLVNESTTQSTQASASAQQAADNLQEQSDNNTEPTYNPDLCWCGGNYDINLGPIKIDFIHEAYSDIADIPEEGNSMVK